MMQTPVRGVQLTQRGAHVPRNNIPLPTLTLGELVPSLDPSRTGTPTPGQELLPLKLRGTCSDRAPEGIRDPEMVQAPPM